MATKTCFSRIYYVYGGVRIIYIKRTQGVAAFNFALIRRFAISIKKEEARVIRKGGQKKKKK